MTQLFCTICQVNTKCIHSLCSTKESQSGKILSTNICEPTDSLIAFQISDCLLYIILQKIFPGYPLERFFDSITQIQSKLLNKNLKKIFIDKR